MAKNIMGEKYKKLNQWKYELANEIRVPSIKFNENRCRKYKYNKYSSGYLNLNPDDWIK